MCHITRLGTRICNTPEVVRICLEQWVPLHFWPYIEMVLASFGQLLSSEEKVRQIYAIAMRDAIISTQLLPPLHCLIHEYQPTIL